MYLPTVFIGQETLKFVSESKYLGFSFSDSKCDDCDMVRQMRSLYVKPTRLRTFSHCSSLRSPCFRVIVPHFIVRFCGPIIGNQHLQRFVLHSTMIIVKKNGPLCP